MIVDKFKSGGQTYDVAVDVGNITNTQNLASSNLGQQIQSMIDSSTPNIEGNKIVAVSNINNLPEDIQNGDIIAANSSSLTELYSIQDKQVEGFAQGSDLPSSVVGDNEISGYISEVDMGDYQNPNSIDINVGSTIEIHSKLQLSQTGIIYPITNAQTTFILFQWDTLQQVSGEWVATKTFTQEEITQVTTQDPQFTVLLPVYDYAGSEDIENALLNITDEDRLAVYSKTEVKQHYSYFDGAVKLITENDLQSTNEQFSTIGQAVNNLQDSVRSLQNSVQNSSQGLRLSKQEDLSVTNFNSLQYAQYKNKTVSATIYVTESSSSLNDYNYINKYGINYNQFSDYAYLGYKSFGSILLDYDDGHSQDGGTAVKVYIFSGNRGISEFQGVDIDRMDKIDISNYKEVLISDIPFVNGEATVVITCSKHLLNNSTQNKMAGIQLVGYNKPDSPFVIPINYVILNGIRYYNGDWIPSKGLNDTDAGVPFVNTEDDSIIDNVQLVIREYTQSGTQKLSWGIKDSNGNLYTVYYDKPKYFSATAVDDVASLQYTKFVYKENITPVKKSALESGFDLIPQTQNEWFAALENANYSSYTNSAEKNIFIPAGTHICSNFQAGSTYKRKTIKGACVENTVLKDCKLYDLNEISNCTLYNCHIKDCCNIHDVYIFYDHNSKFTSIPAILERCHNINNVTIITSYDNSANFSIPKIAYRCSNINNVILRGTLSYSGTIVNLNTPGPTTGNFYIDRGLSYADTFNNKVGIDASWSITNPSCLFDTCDSITNIKGLIPGDYTTAIFNACYDITNVHLNTTLSSGYVFKDCNNVNNCTLNVKQRELYDYESEEPTPIPNDTPVKVFKDSNRISNCTIVLSDDGGVDSALGETSYQIINNNIQVQDITSSTVYSVPLDAVDNTYVISNTPSGGFNNIVQLESNNE